jgi:hypothetical protein
MKKNDLFGDKPLTNRGDRLNPDSTWNHSPSGSTREVVLRGLFVDSSEKVLLSNLLGTFEDRYHYRITITE